MKTQNLTALQKDQLLDFLAHYMPMDIRERLMATLPRAYNAWCGEKVVKVVNVYYDTEVVIEPDQCENQLRQVQ